MPGQSAGRMQWLQPGVLAIAALLPMVAGVGVGATAAQPESLPAFIARIHGGTCEAWVPASYAHQDATPVATEAGGDAAAAQTAAIPVGSTSTTVAVKLEDVVSQPHAVVVYRGTTESPDILACGNVGGSEQADMVVFGLREAGGSDYAGVAELRRHGIIRDQTEVTVYLVPARALLGAEAARGGPPTTPAVEESEVGPTAAPTATEAVATPGGGETPTTAGAPAGVAVDLVDFKFIPSSFSIPADTPVTVTLKNTGQALHNFSIDALRISQDVQPGDTKQVTINAPAGTYEFYCDQPGHKEVGMVGTLTVD